MPPDTHEDRAVQTMEADIKTMAARLAPAREAQMGLNRPKLTSGGLEAPGEGVNASAVAKRLESLLSALQGQAQKAEVLAAALAGPGKMENGPGLNSASKTPDYLFGRQMAALDEISTVVDSLARALERAHRSLG